MGSIDRNEQNLVHGTGNAGERGVNNTDSIAAVGVSRQYTLHGLTQTASKADGNHKIILGWCVRCVT
jgi:hypothetical protein